MESPTFDERIFQKSKTIYKKVKPDIDNFKEELKTIPDFIELWKEIDRLQDLLDQNEGKIPFREGTPKLSQDNIYILKHTLVDLRKQQYPMMDYFKPTIGQHQNKAEFYESSSTKTTNYSILPRGVISGNNDLFFTNPELFAQKDPKAAAINFEQIRQSGKPYFDFTDFTHVYQLILHYAELKNQVRNQPDSLLNNLLQTLDFYIDKANLSEQQLLIIRDKKLRRPNKEIRENLIQELGISHKENYISTIWNKAVKLIIEAVELNYDEYLSKDYQKAWKKCNRCGRLLLRDPRNFVRKNKAADGLTGRCKCCDREIRQGKT